MSSELKLRTRNAPETKARILEAAQAAFSERGYSQTGLRDIASRAGVATSLVVKYYETKANLFDQALRASIELGDASKHRGRFGEILAEAVSDPRTTIPLPSMLTLSLGDDEAREICARVIREEIIAPLANWLGPPQARARAASLLMLGIGFAIFSRHVNFEPSKSVRDDTAKWMAQTIQALIANQ
jgi:AcrR family transcriptional regulator